MQSVLAQVFPSTEGSEEAGVMSLPSPPGRGVLFAGDLLRLNSMG